MLQLQLISRPFRVEIEVFWYPAGKDDTKSRLPNGGKGQLQFYIDLPNIVVVTQDEQKVVVFIGN